MKAYKSSIFRQFVLAGFWIAVSVGPGVLHADEIPGITAQQSDSWSRASDSELDQLRGGFALANGVNVDFSLDRVTYLNGALVASTFFQLPGNASLFQNGALNQAPGMTGPALGSVIQNNVDNQVIRNVTDINIAVSNLKNMDLNNRGMVFNNLILPNAR
ncbi:MAG: hypothetical protein ACXV74_13765 [Methylobacter sp.]